MIALVRAVRPSVYSLYMKLGSQQAKRVVSDCETALEEMTTTLLSALERLERGETLETVLPHADLTAAGQHSFSQTTAREGRASALNDMAVLLTSLDPKPFCNKLPGAESREVLDFLNTGLLLFASVVKKEWAALYGRKTPLFETRLPAPPKKEDTIRVMFLTVSHAFFPALNLRCPHENRNAQSFAERFSRKLWPFAALGQQTLATGDVTETLEETVYYLQSWWFSVGHTQVKPQTPEAKRTAERQFLTLRDELCRQVRMNDFDPTLPAHTVITETINRALKGEENDRFVKTLRAVVLSHIPAEKAPSIELVHP
ncbi:MAG: hypothetical protein LRY51_08500 [Geovibrio sp.]|nr:hypothetical protein [Geovibrio sp.]